MPHFSLAAFFPDRILKYVKFIFAIVRKTSIVEKGRHETASIGNVSFLCARLLLYAPAEDISSELKRPCCEVQLCSSWTSGGAECR